MAACLLVMGMPERRAFSSFLVLTLLTLACLAVLVALGTWQLQRKQWKDGLSAWIKHRTAAAPVPLEAALAEWNATGNVEYLRVRVEGSLGGERQARLYAIDRGRAGWHLIAPLRLTSGAVVLINRGFVPGSSEPGQAPAGQGAAEPIAVTGLVRVPPVASSWFTPANDPAKNIWYSVALPEMARWLGLGQDTALAPFVIEAEATLNSASDAPRGGVTRLAFPNRHLEYALTWYGLALALAAVYAALAWAHLRPKVT